MAGSVEETGKARGAEYLEGNIVSTRLNKGGLRLQGDLEDRIRDLEDKLQKIGEIIAGQSPSAESTSTSDSDDDGPGGTGIRCQ